MTGSLLRDVNLVVRFVAELAGVGALAYWGANLNQPPAIRAVAAIAAPLALIVVWALVVAPGASNPIPLPTRMRLGTVLLLVAAGALWLSGQSTAAIVLGAVVVVNAALLLALGS